MRFLVFQLYPTEHPGRFRELVRRDNVAWDTVALEAGEPIPALGPSAQATLEVAAAEVMTEFRECASALHGGFCEVVRRSRQARGHA